MEAKKLEESCMGFKLPDGKTLLIHDNDIKNIADKMFTHILTMEQERVFLIKDIGIERANKLYEVYQNEKDVMSEKGKQTCLAKIIKYLTEDDYELDTLRNLMEEKKRKNISN